MKKDFTNIDIDRFFRSLDKVDPLMNKNKVHQIISSPSAQARLKGKSFQPLTFIIMTSLLAIVVAVLLWGPAKESPLKSTGNETPSYVISDTTINKNQAVVTIYEEDSSNAAQHQEEPLAAVTPANSKNQSEIENKTSIQTTPVVESEPRPAQEGTGRNGEIPANSLIDSRVSPPATIKGDIKMVVADQELLEKLGFQFIGESVVYSNQTDSISSNYLYLVENGGRVHYRIHNFLLTDTIPVTNKNYYLAAESYRSGSLKSSLKDITNLEEANDTLFPIYCPAGLVTYEPNDIILWFTITPDLIDQLPEAHKPHAKLAMELKTAKRDNPDVNFIDYTTAPLVDASRFIELNKEELFNFGFYIEYDSTLFQTQDGFIKRPLLCYNTNHDSTSTTVKYTNSGSSISHMMESIDEYKNNPELSFITNYKGDFEYQIDKIELNKTSQLIPILVKKDLFDDVVDKNRVYWFNLSDNLFKALPKEISQQLQDEYNYFLAENKDEMEKPACYYLEECKNTLPINNFKVYPNPANSQINVSFTLPEKIEGRISLLDLSGRELQVLLPETALHEGFQQFDMNISHINEGIYMVALYSPQGVQLQRLVIAH